MKIRKTPTTKRLVAVVWHALFGFFFIVCKRGRRKIPSQGLLQQGSPLRYDSPRHCSQSCDCSRLEDTNANIPASPYTCSRSYSCFLFEFDTPDGVWSFSLPALDWADAEEKLRGIRRSGRLLGEIKATLPASRGGLVVRILCVIRNLFILPNAKGNSSAVDD